VEVSRTIISNIILILALIAGGNASAQSASPTPNTSALQLKDGSAPSGLSAYDPGVPASGTTAATTPTIYGGYAGTDGTCGTTATPNSTDTCNSCNGGNGTSGSPKWCNRTSIHPNLVLRMTLVSSTAATFQGGSPRARYSIKSNSSSSSESFDSPSNLGSISLVSGQPFTVEIPWSRLCAMSTSPSDAACTTSFSNTILSVGIDNGDNVFKEKVTFNLTMRSVATDVAVSPTVANCPVGTTPADPTHGICDYTMAPGDEKAYISDYAASGNDLTADATLGIKYDRIMMFYVADVGVTNASAVANNTEPIILSLKNNSPDEPSLSDLGRIRGLENDVNYCFALANVDQAGNITYFPDPGILSGGGKICAEPSKVVGLLDDKSCFITTATYGSQMAPEVQTFREFRNQFLLNNSAGKSFVKFYYKFGPEAAEWISHSQALKMLSLWGLWPVLMFVKLSLLIGLLPAALLALLGTGIIAVFIQRTLRYRNSLKGEA